MGEVEQQTFDAAERELTRKKLIRYAKENGIGAPTLAERIKASHPRGTELPVSTLQQFLARPGKEQILRGAMPSLRRTPDHFRPQCRAWRTPVYLLWRG